MKRSQMLKIQTSPKLRMLLEIAEGKKVAADKSRKERRQRLSRRSLG
jgi:hypothetical protein